MSSSKIQIFDSENNLLKEFKQNQTDQAYEYAEQMELMDIEVRIVSPSLPQTLAETLGAKQEELAILQQELEEEIDDHIPNNGCHLCQ